MILMNSLSDSQIISCTPNEIRDLGDDRTRQLTSQKAKHQPDMKSLLPDL